MNFALVEILQRVGGLRGTRLEATITQLYANIKGARHELMKAGIGAQTMGDITNNGPRIQQEFLKGAVDLLEYCLVTMAEKFE